MINIENRFFKLWAYTVSHNFLIIRSLQKFPDQDDFDNSLEYNIDIEFSAVAYIDLPSTFKGFFLERLHNDKIPERFAQYANNYKVFKISSEGNLFYVVAGNLKIGTNKWIVEDRISNLELKYDEILLEM